MKLQISINDELMKRVDTYAADNYMNRSQLFAVAVTEYMNAHEVTIFIRELTLAMKRIAESGEVDQDTMKKLEDFERLSKMLIPK